MPNLIVFICDVNVAHTKNIFNCTRILLNKIYFVRFRWSLIVQGILALGIIFTYPIQFYVPVEIIWPGIKEKYGPFESPKTLEMSLRVALVFVTCKCI